ncbi:hypothetical protein IKE99_01215 [Candidatus Saccharibacteria bacterium]|nr:hypothetical protein [Candidatus Saccharibacteria bacterium]
MLNLPNSTEFLKDIGVGNADQETKSEIIAKIEYLAKERLILKVLEKLTEEQIAEFNNIEDEGQSVAWLETKIPELPFMISDIFMDLKDEIIAQKVKIMEQQK